MHAYVRNASDSQRVKRLRYCVISYSDSCSGQYPDGMSKDEFSESFDPLTKLACGRAMRKTLGKPRLVSAVEQYYSCNQMGKEALEEVRVSILKASSQQENQQTDHFPSRYSNLFTYDK